MYSSTYFPLALWGDVAVFLFWFGWDFVELVDIVAYVFHDTAWTLVKPQWRLFKAFGGGRGRIQSNLVRIQLDLSFRVVFSRICSVSSRIWGVSSRIWGVSSWVWGVSSRIGWAWRKNFNPGVGHFQWRCQKSNGGIEKGQWGHWKNPAGVLCRVNGALVRISAGIEKGYRANGGIMCWWGSMGVLGVGEGQCVNAGIEKGQWRRWSGNGGSMGALKRINGGIGQGQWGYWKGSMGALVRVNGGMEKGQVRGLALGGVAVGQTGVWLWVRQEVVLQGCKLYLAGL